MHSIQPIMGSGLHGENGLYPETSITLAANIRSASSGIRVGGCTSKSNLGREAGLERTYKQFVKQILLLPVTVADPAVYILSGAMPIEGFIHKRTLVLLGSFCRLGGESVKWLARRQLTVKSFESNGWFVATCKLFLKYDLPDCWDVVENPSSKTQ